MSLQRAVSKLYLLSNHLPRVFRDSPLISDPGHQPWNGAQLNKFLKRRL